MVSKTASQASRSEGMEGVSPRLPRPPESRALRYPQLRLLPTGATTSSRTPTSIPTWSALS